jgi:hypothetical protein
LNKEARVTIQRIHPGSLAKVLAVLYAILGVIGGVLFAAMGAMGFGLGSIPGAGGLGMGVGFGIAAIVIFPICYAVLGFVGGWVVASLYNWIARSFGGIVLETR